MPVTRDVSDHRGIERQEMAPCVQEFVVASREESIGMLTSILGARLRWHQADGWVFDPVIVGPDIIEYTLKEGPHAGRHAIQHTYYQRVAPGIETTAWYEETGTVVHITWYLET